MTSDIAKTCPQCDGRGVVPAEGHTREQLDAVMAQRMEDGARRLAEVAARDSDD